MKFLFDQLVIMVIVNLTDMSMLISCFPSIVNSGDGIEYGQRRRENIGDLIAQTLNLLEKYGGEGAFNYIKYMVPTYQSCQHGQSV